MSTSDRFRNKTPKRVDDLVKAQREHAQILDDSMQEVIAYKDKKASRYELLNSSSSKTIHKEKDYQDMDVPIYRLQTTSYTIDATMSEEENSFFATGTLIGNFYTIDGQVKLEKVKFIGNFKGAVEYDQDNLGDIYFQGQISQFLVIRTRDNQSQLDPFFQELEYNETNFTGFFKGAFYRWSDIPTLSDQQISPKKLFRLQNKLSNSFYGCMDCNNYIREQLESTKKLSKVEYFLPTVVRFQVQDIRQIYLDRSLAAISGAFFVEIKYNDEIKGLIRQTNKVIKESKNSQKYKNLLKIQLNFHRDYNLTLELEDDDDGADSEGSEWSIMDKTWDIVKQDDQKNQILKFKIWKRFNAQIDNSYGSFFAPFNLSSLKIVMTLHHFLVLDEKGNNVKVHLIGTDVFDYDPKEGYNPFRAFNDLEAHRKMQEITRVPHINRIHKINRFKCTDTGTFMIADNRLRLYPYWRNILQNTYTQNESWTYALGIKERVSLFQMPEVRSISESFNYFSENSFKENSEQENVKIENFKFQKWSYIIIEVPIFKYLVIDMIQVFVPLFLLAGISLLIFTSENGIYDGQYSIIAYRLINVASLMIAYVSLIPVIRQNMPPMPGVTLIELITYFEVAPNLLAILSSLLEYETPYTQWQIDYRVFKDGLFIASFVISMLNLLALVTLFTVYILKEYRINRKILLPLQEFQRAQNYKYRSPCYLQFMEKVRKNRKQCILTIPGQEEVKE